MLEVPKRRNAEKIANPTPNRTPRIEPINPWISASKTKSLMTKESKAPRHFRVPISLNLSVTDINWALMMPTTQTNRDKKTIQRCLGEAETDELIS